MRQSLLQLSHVCKEESTACASFYRILLGCIKAKIRMKVLAMLLPLPPLELADHTWNAIPWIRAALGSQECFLGAPKSVIQCRTSARGEKRKSPDKWMKKLRTCQSGEETTAAEGIASFCSLAQVLEEKVHFLWSRIHRQKLLETVLVPNQLSRYRTSCLKQWQSPCHQQYASRHWI